MAQELRRIPTRFFSGLYSMKFALTWLRQHPKYIFFLSLPLILNAIFLIIMMKIIFTWGGEWISSIVTFETTNFFLTTLSYMTKGLLYVSAFLLLIPIGMITSNILSCPIYEYVSTAVEVSITGVAPPSISFRKTISLLFEELKKIFFILLISILVLWVPVLNLFSIFITSTLLGWEFYDYPMARHGWNFDKRLRFMLKDFFSIMGLGLWLLIPFVQIFVAPLALVSGTMLSLDELKARNLLKEF